MSKAGLNIFFPTNVTSESAFFLSQSERTGVRARIQRVIPHPNPLPKGEGTCSALQSESVVFSQIYLRDGSACRLGRIREIGEFDSWINIDAKSVGPTI